MTKPQLYTAKMDAILDDEDLRHELIENGFLEGDYVTGQLIYDNVGRPIITDSFEAEDNGLYSDGSWVVVIPETLEEK